MKLNRNVNDARRRAMLEDSKANPRRALRLQEEDDEEIEIEADAVQFDDEGEDGDIESQVINLIKAMKADGMLPSVTLEDEEETTEEDDDEGEGFEESKNRAARARRIAEARKRVAMFNRKNEAAKSNKRGTLVEASPAARNRARRIAEARARMARRRLNNRRNGR